MNNPYEKVLYKFPDRAGESFMPSNGTEGDVFQCAFCYQCIHERWMHNMEEDKEEDKCDIWSFAMMEDSVPEWKFDSEGWPHCTEWEKWDWGNGDDDDGWGEPDKPNIPDPNQLDMFPLYPDETIFEKQKIYEEA